MTDKKLSRSMEILEVVIQMITFYSAFMAVYFGALQKPVMFDEIMKSHFVSAMQEILAVDVSLFSSVFSGISNSSIVIFVFGISTIEPSIAQT